MPLAPARRDLAHGPVVHAVAVDVLADVSRVVAGLAQPVGDEALAVVLLPGLESARGREVAVDLGVVRVAAGHHDRARGAAQGEGGERLREGRALVLQERLDRGEDLEVVGDHVVGLDDDEVGSLVRARGRGLDDRITGRGKGSSACRRDEERASDGQCDGCRKTRVLHSQPLHSPGVALCRGGALTLGVAGGRCPAVVSSRARRSRARWGRCTQAMRCAREGRPRCHRVARR